MTMVRTDAEIFRDAAPLGPAPMPAGRSPDRIRIVRFAILAVAGLLLGAVAGLFAMLASGLIALC